MVYWNKANDNFIKNMFLRAVICPFTNCQICERTNNSPIDLICRFVNFLDLFICAPAIKKTNTVKFKFRRSVFKTLQTKIIDIKAYAGFIPVIPV